MGYALNEVLTQQQIATAAQTNAEAAAIKQAAQIASQNDDSFYFGDPTKATENAWNSVVDPTGAGANYFPDQSWFTSYIAKQNTSPTASKVNYPLVIGGAIALFFLLKKG